MHANHVDVVAKLRNLFPDQHDLVECPHALPCFQLRQILVYLLEAGIQILHRPLIAQHTVAAFSTTSQWCHAFQLFNASVTFDLLGLHFSKLVPKVAMRLYDLSLASYDYARGRLRVKRTFRSMQTELSPHDADWTAEIHVGAAHLHTLAVDVLVSLQLTAIHQVPAYITAGFTPCAGEEVSLTFRFLDRRITLSALHVTMITQIVLGFEAQLFVAVCIWTEVVLKLTFCCCVSLDHLTLHFLGTAAGVVGTFDDQVVELGPNQASGTGTLKPTQALSVDGASCAR